MVLPNCVAKIGENYENNIEGLQITPNKISSLPGYVGSQPNGVVTYCLINETGDIPDGHMQVTAMNLAVTLWGLIVKNIKFKRVKVTDNPMITCKFVRDPTLFPSPSTLAVTYYPTPTNGILAGTMNFNDDPKLIWSLNGKPISAHVADPIHYPDPNTTVQIQTINLISVLCHEFGHALGFQHLNDDVQNMMYFTYQDTLKLSPEDTQYAQGLYGNRGLAQHIIDSVDIIIRELFS